MYCVALIYIWWIIGGMMTTLGQSVSNTQWQQHAGYRAKPVRYEPNTPPGFTRLAPAQTGVTFANLLTPESDATNNNYINGSGVALGDVDGDGWCDLYFCSLNGTNTLYKNLGQWKFADVTAESGLGLVNQFSRGATLADVDGDSDLDLVLTFNSQGARLFRNDGQGRFKEDLKPGLAPTRGSFSAATGDVDGDGCLDLYVANYGENTVLRSGGNIAVRYVNGRPVVAGRWARRLRIVGNSIIELGEVHNFYLNDGQGRFILQPWRGGKFLNEAGQPLTTNMLDFGLSVQIRDVNQDGHPDIYVCNDFQTPDHLWLNDGRGRFQLCPHLTFRSLPYASMGVDFADIDRDGWLDQFGVEMRPSTHERLLRQTAGLTFTHPTLGEFAHCEYVPRNILSWNRGDGTYAELAWFAGVAATDWSWMPLFLDVDLDGYEDLLVVNGFSHNSNDLDAMEESKGSGKSVEEFRAKLLMIAPYISANYAFHNQRNCTFKEVGQQWGFDSEDISHGMAVADLDNDGDLDVVVNCLNAPALVYRNQSSAPRLAVRLKGKPKNTQGINAMIRVHGDPVPVQMQEMLSGARYLSSDEAVRSFACGTATNLTIEVTWRSGQRSVVPARPDFIYEIEESTAQSLPPVLPVPPTPTPLFQEVSDLLHHRHIEEPFDDFARQPLLPNRLSQSGPGLAWFDLDGDGHEDLIIGSGKGGTLGLFRNDGQGKFSRFNTQTSTVSRDTTTLLGWYPPSGRPALLLGSASYEDGLTNEPMVLQLTLTNLSASITHSLSSVGPLALADVDGDGDLDLFAGGRVIPGRYPEPASSFLFLNDKGHFKNDTKNQNRFNKLGLVTSARFSDLNQDGQPDLVLACEWGPIRVFYNQQGQFHEATQELGLSQLTGWWTGLATGDFDGDGRMDIVAGNWGLNSPYKASVQHPARLYYGDFNGMNEINLVEAYEELTPGKIVPRRGLADLSANLPFLKWKYGKHRHFAQATVADLLGETMKQAAELRAVTLASTLFLNRTNHFEAIPLPAQAQWAPVFAVCVGDYDGDGWDDLFLSQNFFATRLGGGRLDAGRGLWLRNSGRGQFTAIPGQESGIGIYGEQRGAALGDYDGDGRVDLAVSQNGAQTMLYKNVGGKPGLRIRLKGLPGNPTGVGAQLRMIKQRRKGPVREIHAGSGWWSQDSAIAILAPGDQLELRWPWGRTITIPVDPSTREIEIASNGEIKRLR